jgi:LacI family transcriptional regulator
MRKPPTIDDVAVALGMHKSTVSKALSGTGNVSLRTRARVRSTATELGYEPNPVAQRLANGYRNPTVYIFSGSLDLGLTTQKIRLIQQNLTARSLEVPLYTCPGPAGDDGKAQAAQIRQLCRQRPRAIICAVPMLSSEIFGELEAYQREGGIVVSYDAPIPLACDQVIFDREDNGYQAARCLLLRGHTRVGIGMSKTPPRPPGAADTPQSQRLRGFLRALDEFGVPYRPEWRFENAHYEEGGEEMARRFLSLTERPTGICIVNDYVAFAFMVDITRAGVRVPDEISIVSHDNQPIASRCPVPMTAVSHPAERIASAVVEMLLERLDGFDGAPRTVTIRGELVERASVAAPQR